MRKLLLTLLVCSIPFPAFAETAYERLVKTDTLRCGFGAWEPGVTRDPETGKMKGLFVELIEEMARMARIKVDWVAEVDWGQIPTSLRSNKIDAFCAGMAADAERAKYMAYTTPFSYWTFDVITRAGDERFPSDRPLTVKDLNKSEFSTAYTEGDVLETIKETELSKVKGVPLPPLGTPADNIMNVLTKKTDFVIFPRVMIQNYEKENGKDKLRLLELETPLRTYGNVLAIDIDEPELKSFLNAAITELVHSSAYDRIMSKYDKDYPGSFLRVAKPYEDTQ